MSGKDTPFEIPEQIRDFADKSIDHARKAFDDYLRQSRQAIAGFEEQAEKMKSDSKDVQERILDQAEENVAAAMDYARQMVNAGSSADLVEIQRSFLEQQMKALTEQSKDMAEAAQAAMAAMTKPPEK